MQRTLIYLVFFLSGFASLIYQIIWLRKIELFMGVTAEATSVVVASFMAGLGLGAWFIGKYGDYVKNPVLLYAVLELLIGAFGLLSNETLDLFSHYYIKLVSDFPLSHLNLTVIRIIFVAAFLSVPTLLMGATLPILIRGIGITKETVGDSSATLYAVDTLGAAAGTFAAGFYMIEAFGLRKSLLIACCINIFAGLVCILLRIDAENLKTEEKHVMHKFRDRLPVLLAFAGCGFVTLGYEVLWARYIISFYGDNSVQTFSFVLTVYLLGIVIGSCLVRRQADYFQNPSATFSFLLFLISAAVLWGLVLTNLISFLLAGYETSTINATAVIQVLILILMPMMISGAAFALAAILVMKNADAFSTDLGVLYSSNTVGGVLGALLVGFFLLPNFGAYTSFFILIFVNLLLILPLVISNRAFWPTRKQGIFVAALFLAGVFLTAYIPKASDIHLLSVSKKILFNQEDSVSSVAVVETSDKNRILFVNGDAQAATFPSAQTHLRFLGDLPALFHPNPRRGLIIALGTGITAHSLSLHPFKHIDIVELSSVVPRALNYFNYWNRDILSDPRIRLIQNDGRNFLLTNQDFYDVITTDPLDADDAGVTSLYSKEFYALIKSRLNPGGVAAQWIASQFHIDDYRMLIRSFQEVFPVSAIWNAHFTTVLVGINGQPGVSLDELHARISAPEFADELSQLGLEEGADLLSKLVAGPKEIAEFVKNAEINTDDHPLAEYRMPRRRGASDWSSDILPALKKLGPVDYSGWFKTN